MTENESKSVLIFGAGQIGRTVAHLLARINQFDVNLLDLNITTAQQILEPLQLDRLTLNALNINDENAISHFILSHSFSCILNCLPYTMNEKVAKLAYKYNLHYFDLTEDTASTGVIENLARVGNSLFVTQCGLAPGLVNILAHECMQGFSTIDTVAIRTGGLPAESHNALQYAFTWSPDGLLNEYIQPCPILEDGHLIERPALTGLESVTIQGRCFEAFYTSGGLGGLPKDFAGKVRSMDYKTLRYPGHCEKMRFLLEDLKLKNHLESLKSILLDAIPYTTDDLVVVYISVTGKKILPHLTQTNIVREFISKTIDDVAYSGLQLATAAALCAIVSECLQYPSQKGFFPAYKIPYSNLKTGPFGDFL